MNSPLASPGIWGKFRALYLLGEQWINLGQDVLLLIIRLTWGFQFALTGWGKFGNIPKVVTFFTNLGIPAPTLNAYFVSSVELFGGIFLILGLLGRLTPLPLIGTMVVAYITTEQDALKALMAGNPDPFFAAAPFLFLFASVILWVFGPGRASLDYFLFSEKVAKEEKK